MGKGNLPTQDALLATIEAVHAAGLDAAHWPRALATVAQTFGGHAAMFEVYDKRTSMHREFYAYGVPPAAEIAYLEHYMANNPRWLFMPRQRTNDIGCDYKLIDESGMNKAPFYTELLARLDLRYFMSGVLMATPDDYACISVQRSVRQGHVQQDEIGLMQRLLPHVQQAFDVARRLKGANEGSKPFEQAFDWITDGVALVAANGTVTYANEALQGLARRNDIVRLRKGSLEFLTTDARMKFNAALDATVRLRAGETHHPAPADFAVPRAPELPPYLISVRPLARAADNRAIALVFVRDPLTRGDAAGHILREVFGFTEAETSVALALHAGVAPAQYAHTNGVSLNTVYTHLRRIREKTATHSVSELIRKLDEFRIPVQPK